MTGSGWELLSIDFGTSHTVAVLRGSRGQSRPLLFDGTPLLPSAVCAQPDGTLVVGRDALHLARDDPARFEPNPKRRIDEESLLLGERAHPVVEVVAALLLRVAAEAGRAIGAAPPPVVLTHPEEWAAPRRQLLRAAAERVGLQVLAMVPEPVAAARYYTAVLGHTLAVGQSLAIFDFGGGTLDVAVLRRTPGGFAVTATGGAGDLGGVDLDAAIVAWLRGTVVPDAPAWRPLDRPETAADRRNRATLWSDARMAKEILSRSTTTPVHVPGIGSTHLTRTEFDELVDPLVVRAVDLAARALARSAGPLAGLFLVGGATRVPLVAQRLHQRLGIAPTVLEQPEIAVAEGALHEVGGVSPRVRAALDRLAVPPPRPFTPQPEPVAVTVTAEPQPRRRFSQRTGWLALAAATVVAAVVSAALLSQPTKGPDNRARSRSAVGFTPLNPPSPSFLNRPPSDLASDLELQEFTRAWDGHVWSEGCRRTDDPEYRPDGARRNQIELDPVSEPTDVVHCRGGDFEAIFALYPGNDASRVEKAYAKSGEAAVSSRLPADAPTLHRLRSFGSGRNALMWRRGHAIGWLLTGRAETDLLLAWTAAEYPGR